MSGGRISEADRETYRALADALLPASGRMPKASAVGVADELLDRVLGWRPDLIPDMLRGLAAAHPREPVEALAFLEQTDGEAWRALRTAILGSYYLDPTVMAALGYDGQQSRPVGPMETPGAQDALLEPVKARGPIWRGA